MRPVSRGAAPAGAFANYRDAATPLIAAIGDYCSYCERQIPTHLAIEHIQPKSLVAVLLTVWDNFLLACVNCNSCKGTTPIVLQDYFWPDSDNTMRALEYKTGGLVEPAHGLSLQLLGKARSTVQLVGLDRYPGNPDHQRRPKHADCRWQHRRQLWDCAQRARARLLTSDSVELREQIVECAVLRGSFSIWFTNFLFDQDMRQRLVAGFVGTSSDCFDPTCNLIARVTGAI